MGRGDNIDQLPVSRFKLLSREQFREQVFARDKRKCVICGEDAVDAHHILDRKLFSDGGYYLENGASLCEEHHWQAENTQLSVEQLREATGATRDFPMPDTLITGEQTDKWGNQILPSGQRVQGPLFDDQGCQKALQVSGALALFTEKVKYPRTLHLPWSQGLGEDDGRLASVDNFIGQEVVVTLKEDGENTTIGADYCHARSLDTDYHPSRTLVRTLAARIGHQLPQGWRVCGENLQGQHSISYKNAPAFVLFSIWDERNRCLDWQQTEEWAQLLEVPTVQTLYRGVFDQDRIHDAFESFDSPYSDEKEGYVVRLSSSFPYNQFRNSVAKFVRADHVNDSDKHWISGEVKLNEVSL